MSEDATRPDDLGNMSDLEKRVLTVLSVLEANLRSEESDEYSLPDGRRIRPTVEGIRSFLKDGAAIETEKMRSSVDQLLQKELIVKKSDCHFLSDTGKRVGKKLKTERMSKGYDNLLLRTEASKAYSTFCERVFSKDLSQFNVLGMEQLNTLIEKLDLKPGETALDLGCGNGRVAEHISDLTGAKMIGLDFAAEVIKSAQQRTIDKKSRLTYVVGNMDELSLEEESFDAVVSIDTLYFVESIDATIRELKRLLKPSTGRLAIFCDQDCSPDESRDILLPENTKVGKAMRNSGLIYQAIDFTSNSRGIWRREIEAAEELREQFAKEGNTDIYEDRAQDAKKTLESIESGRHARYFYFARLQEQADADPETDK
jgi:ubiquinone/menaquinone biosynthesis C-methylase UbiE